MSREPPFLIISGQLLTIQLPLVQWTYACLRKASGDSAEILIGPLERSTVAAGVGEGDAIRGGVGTTTAAGFWLGVGDPAGEGETVGIAVGVGDGPLFELVVNFGYKSKPATPTKSSKTKRTPISATTHGHLGFAAG